MKNKIVYLLSNIDVCSAKIRKKSETTKSKPILSLYSSEYKLFMVVKK